MSAQNNNGDLFYPKGRRRVTDAPLLSAVLLGRVIRGPMGTRFSVSNKMRATLTLTHVGIHRIVQPAPASGKRATINACTFQVPSQNEPGGNCMYVYIHLHTFTYTYINIYIYIWTPVFCEIRNICIRYIIYIYYICIRYIYIYI